MWKQGKLKLRRGKDYMFYFEPKAKKGYVERKMEHLRNHPWKFCCFNSLDKAEEQDRKTILDWMDATVRMD